MPRGHNSKVKTTIVLKSHPYVQRVRSNSGLGNTTVNPVGDPEGPYREHNGNHCSSALSLSAYGRREKPENYWVQIGTLDHPEVVSLDFHYGVETQLSWVHFDDELPRTRCDEDPALAAAFASVNNRAE